MSKFLKALGGSLALVCLTLFAVCAIGLMVCTTIVTIGVVVGYRVVTGVCKLLSSSLSRA